MNLKAKFTEKPLVETRRDLLLVAGILLLWSSVTLLLSGALFGF